LLSLCDRFEAAFGCDPIHLFRDAQGSACRTSDLDVLVVVVVVVATAVSVVVVVAIVVVIVPRSLGAFTLVE